jgi:ribosomal protein L3 glutamine methyltransferase
LRFHKISVSRLESLKSVTECIRWVETRLNGAELYFGHGTDNALDEAAWLVGACLGIDPVDLDGAHNRTVRAAERKRILNLVEQRIATRKPLAYLLHEAWFAGCRFFVDENVLIPRSHVAEFILERFQPWIRLERVRRALDLGTGSGCIAIALTRAFPDAHVDATDVSPGALTIARQNIEAYGLANRIRVLESDFFSALSDIRYDLIVTNPPYVAADELKTLPHEYRFEPEIALEAGTDGLNALTAILVEAGRHLEKGGILVAETGNSRPALQKRFPAIPFTWLTTSTGDECVFMLTAEQLDQYRNYFGR